MEKKSMEALGRLSVADYKTAEKHPIVLVLDNIRSGMNVGAMFRTADAFALAKLILCGITAQPPHREILKTALGSTETVEWEWAATTEEAINNLKSAGYIVFAIEQTDHPKWLHDMTVIRENRYAFVLGNEVEGVNEAALALCDAAVEIPQFGSKHSLNVSVAAGMVVWEAVRQLRYTPGADR